MPSRGHWSVTLRCRGHHMGAVTDENPDMSCSVPHGRRARPLLKRATTSVTPTYTRRRRHTPNVASSRGGWGRRAQSWRGSSWLPGLSRSSARPSSERFVAALAVARALFSWVYPRYLFHQSRDRVCPQHLATPHLIRYVRAGFSGAVQMRRNIAFSVLTYVRVTGRLGSAKRDGIIIVHS